MSPDDEADDDRTVIRPPAPPPPAAPAQPSHDERTVAVDKTLAVGAPPPPAERHDDDGGGLPIGTRLGEFEILQKLAEGGFGVVYLANDHSLQRRVALKEYMPSSLATRTGATQVQAKSERLRETFEAGRKSFINEARMLAQFDHRSLLKVYRFWEANGTAYMVMPFIEGTNLKDMLRAMGGPPDEAWLRTLLEPLTEALAVIHAAQCYHRDIAPDNVMMLAGSHRPLLLDFGAARQVIGDMTQALTVILKPGYAPVEQYAEIPGMKQGPWTDVYALAAVVYYAITGKTPPPSVGRLLNDTYVPLSEAAAGRYSEGFLAAIDRALAVRPEQRTQNIEQLRADLGLHELAPDPYATRPLPSDGSVPARPAAPAPAARAASGAAPAAPASAARGPAVWIGAGALVLAAVGFGAYTLLTPSPRPAAPVAAAPVAAPATAAAPLPATAPAPGPSTFDVPKEFERVVQAQRNGFGLQALAEKSTLRIGRDELAFTVQSEREGFLYVLAYDSEGTLVQLLPNTLSGSVKLRKGQRYRFPSGDGAVVNISGPAGPGQLLVMVSARQRSHEELEPKKEGSFRFFPTGAEAQAIAARHTGANSVLAGRAICPSAAVCDDEYGAAIVKVDVVP